ncbi:MAG: hypothetical protein GX102_15385 [Porphyromonadaceae bacterium]|jgi:hypothetical protein|nr:hypothetical protein [Porphyromonadaceae bacterium]
MKSTRDIRFNRDRFDKGQSYYGRHGIAAQTAQLRIEVPTVKGKGVYDFDLKKEVKRLSEKILKRNDLFVVRAIGLGFMVEADGMEGHAPVYSYPVIKPTAGALIGGLKGLTNGHAFVVYNGAISIKTGQQVNYSAFPTSEFLHIPQVQASDTAMPEFDLADLLVELPEEVALAGTQDHRIQLEFPANANTNIAGEADSKAYIVMIFEGWLYEGATNEKYKTADNPYRNVI